MSTLRPYEDPALTRRPRRRRLKTVAIFPTLLTLGNLLSGFMAIYFCMRAVYNIGAGINLAEVRTVHIEQWERLLPSFLAISAWCIAMGLIFDALDGRVARMSHQSSPFGVQLDSLADVVTFGVAPAILILALWTTTKHSISPLGADTIGRGQWMLLALYVACAAMRLARFNVETGTEESAHRSFRGLPSPAAAGFVAMLVASHERLISFAADNHAWADVMARTLLRSMPFVAGVLGLLMVSRIEYTHLVSVYLRGRRPLGHVVVGLAILVIFVISPEFTAATFLLLYVGAGMVRYAARLARGSSPEQQPAAAETPSGTDADQRIA